MMRKPAVLICLLISLSTSAPATISRATPEEEQRIRFISSPAEMQQRPTWAPVRPLYGNTGFPPVAREMLTAKDPFTRARGAFLHGLVGDTSCADEIAALLTDRDRTARVFSGLALGFLGDERGIHVCDSALKADPDWVRYYAVYALWYMNSPRAKAVLNRSAGAQSAFIKGVIADALKTPFQPVGGKWRIGGIDAPLFEDIWAAVFDAFIAESDAWWHKGSYDQTIRCQEAAVFWDPNHVEGYSLIAWLQWSQGDDAAAIRTLERGTKAVPQGYATWGALGQHYWMTKRYALAEEPLRKAVELGGDHLIRRPYAHSLEKLGKLEECLRQWEAIVAECPNDDAARNNLERLRGKLAE